MEKVAERGDVPPYPGMNHGVELEASGILNLNLYLTLQPIDNPLHNFTFTFANTSPNHALMRWSVMLNVEVWSQYGELTEIPVIS